MATLTIRNVDPEVHQRLRERAAGNGRSVEAELRQILQDVVQVPSQNMLMMLRSDFVPGDGVELELPTRAERARSVDFS